MYVHIQSSSALPSHALTQTPALLPTHPFNFFFFFFHVSEGAFLFEFTRKNFSDVFPLPFVEQDVAQFLLSRGKFAWLGFNWMGCVSEDQIQYLRPSQMDVDYGTPEEEYCRETAPGSGIFTREWSRASVKIDCNTWKPTITMKDR